MPAEAWWAIAVAAAVLLLLWRLRRSRRRDVDQSTEDRDGDLWDSLSEGKDPTI